MSTVCHVWAWHLLWYLVYHPRMSDTVYRRVEDGHDESCEMCAGAADKIYMVEFGWYGREISKSAAVNATSRRYRKIDDAWVALCNRCLEQDRRVRRRTLGIRGIGLLVASLAGAYMLDVLSILGAPPEYTLFSIVRAEDDTTIIALLILSVVAFTAIFAVYFLVDSIKTFSANWLRSRGLELAWSLNRERIEAQLSNVDAFEVFYPNGLSSLPGEHRATVGQPTKRTRQYELKDSTGDRRSEQYIYWIGYREKEVDSWEGSPASG